MCWANIFFSLPIKIPPQIYLIAPFSPTTFVPKATFCWKTAQIKHKGNRKLIYEIYIREIWRFIPCKVMNYLKIYARNTSSIASIRPFGLVYIVFNWDRPLWRPLAHINDTNLYMKFENSRRAHLAALRPPHRDPCIQNRVKNDMILELFAHIETLQILKLRIYS